MASSSELLHRSEVLVLRGLNGCLVRFPGSRGFPDRLLSVPTTLTCHPYRLPGTHHSLQVLAQLVHHDVQSRQLVHHVAQLLTGVRTHLLCLLHTLDHQICGDVRAQVERLCMFTDGVDFSYRKERISEEHSSWGVRLATVSGHPLAWSPEHIPGVLPLQLSTSTRKNLYRSHAKLYSSTQEHLVATASS